MTKVITYGTFDMLHKGHINLLKHAKALGDYLIVGVTSDNFDKIRGKINNRQSLIDRIKAVKDLNIADEIIVEEYEGQKIDDIKKYDIDIFTVGSDWTGYFDYLNEYCKVVYLPRTEGISSSDIRTNDSSLKIKIIGDDYLGDKFKRESAFVNGVKIVEDDNYDAAYIVSDPKEHYNQIKCELNKNKHILCESPIALSIKECEELFLLAKSKKLILMEGIKTAYSTAYSRLLLIAKGGAIGDIISIDSTCTSMRENLNERGISSKWNSIEAWGPTALLPIFQLLGVSYKNKSIITRLNESIPNYDDFTKIDFIYQNSAASIKVAKQAKSEGELVISGTKGYIYVPAPWWKTDYFEVRYEKAENNKRYFYQFEGDGIRYEILAFSKAIQSKSLKNSIKPEITMNIASVIEDFLNKKDTYFI